MMIYETDSAGVTEQRIRCVTSQIPQHCVFGSLGSSTTP